MSNISTRMAINLVVSGRALKGPSKTVHTYMPFLVRVGAQMLLPAEAAASASPPTTSMSCPPIPKVSPDQPCSASPDSAMKAQSGTVLTTLGCLGLGIFRVVGRVD